MADASKTIILRDGRTLGYTEHGDLSGQPVIFIHGNPGSRFMRHPDESIAASLGIRLVTPDRPGYGLSDYQTKRTLLDFPEDMVQLADALQIDKFAIFGTSAGGPYTAACAYKLPNRITKAAIVSGAAPMNRDDAYEGMHPDFVKAFKLAQWPFWLLRLLMAVTDRLAARDPEKSLQQSLEMTSAHDAEILNDPAIREQVKGYRAEAIRRGVKGRVQESKILVSPWGFSPSQIQVETHLWYWEDDTLVPISHGRYLDAHIPNSVPHFLPGGGHFSIFEHWREILAALIDKQP